MDTKPFSIFSRSPLWAIRPEAIGSVLQLSARWEMHGGADQWAVAKPSVVGRGEAKTAVIPIRGVLTKDGPAWYGSNYDSITAALESAGNDPDVKRVVLAVDSPGGEVTGLPEAATVLAQVAKVKPVSAIVEGQAGSAAYWLTSQVSEIALTPSGEVGSVGVRMMHADMSKMLDDMGVKITELSSGDFKTEWSPYKPLSEGAAADMQKRLQATHNDFIKAVASGRGSRATAEVAKGRFGEGRMFSSTEAKAHGLVDRLQSPRDFYRSTMQPHSEAAHSVGFRRAQVEVERIRF